MQVGSGTEVGRDGLFVGGSIAVGVVTGLWWENKFNSAPGWIIVG